MEKLPFDIYCIEDDVGRIIDLKEPCPGVYYVCIAPEDCESPSQGEMYIVAADTPYISDEAKRYGEPLPSHPNFLQYITDSFENGRHIVEYEFLRYRVQRHLEIPKPMSNLTSAAAFGRELYPDYFGAFPAPLHTPRGLTARYKALMDGVFAIETDQCEKFVAVCNPIWSCDPISKYTRHQGMMTDYDTQHGIDNTMGYLFFDLRSACLVLFELWKDGGGLAEAIDAGVIDTLALMNAVWKYHPDYAAIYNVEEQAGLHNFFGVLLNTLGAGIDLNDNDLEKNFISIFQDAGTEYLKF